MEVYDTSPLGRARPEFIEGFRVKGLLFSAPS